MVSDTDKPSFKGVFTGLASEGWPIDLIAVLVGSPVHASATSPHALLSVIVVRYARPGVPYPFIFKNMLCIKSKLTHTSGELHARSCAQVWKTLFSSSHTCSRCGRELVEQQAGERLPSPSETTCYCLSWYKFRRKLFRFASSCRQRVILPRVGNCRKNQRKSTHNRLCLICSRPATYRDMVVWDEK